ncbi:PAS domain S-box protein [Ideonella sp.]|uniref:PAS domain-containing hybrid sensor histidine kinase/response regulator n=1 Tax=Ideonella sp. TaxID=1929293 RepID=UPI0035B48E03
MPQASDEGFRLLVDSVTDYAIFMLDPDGRVISWNAGAQRIKGYLPSEIIGQSFERFYPADRVESGWPREELRRAALQGRIEDEGWRLRKDGTRFWASVVITALHDSSGQLKGFAKVTRDLTERRLQDEVLRRSEEQFRLLVEGVKDYALFMLDPDGHVLTWNSGAAAITGYTASEVLARHFSMFFTDEDAAAGKPAAELAQALATGRAEIEGQRVRKDGSAYWANVIITPVWGTEGVHRGFAKVTRDLSQQRRLLELEQASRSMNEFIAMLAHELRNPLAPIRNAVSVIKMQPGLPELVQKMGEMVDRQALHLTRLVDDLLDVGRIATGKLSLRKEDLDLREIVLASVDAVRPLMAAKRHQLQVDAPRHIQVHGDATRLAQLLQNLLINAARYTPPGGQVSISTAVDGARCITRVRDNGQGVAPEALQRIFGLFEQEPGVARDPSESSLGIGLTLARTMAELHGGSLVAHSEGRGCGAMFELVLPCQPSASAAAGGLAAPAPRVNYLRVLVVDDNRDSADSMVTLLEQLGHEAYGAYNAEHALQLAQKISPTLVLLDLSIPGQDGFEIIRLLRQTMDQPMCIVAVTGYGQRSDRERTREAGFDEHLTKPVELDQLLQVVKRACDLIPR